MHVNEQNLNKNKTKSRHIKIVTSRYIVQFSPQTMQWYREKMTSLSDVIFALSPTPPPPPPPPTPPHSFHLKVNVICASPLKKLRPG